MRWSPAPSGHHTADRLCVLWGSMKRRHFLSYWRCVQGLRFRPTCVRPCAVRRGQSTNAHANTADVIEILIVIPSRCKTEVQPCERSSSEEAGRCLIPCRAFDVQAERGQRPEVAGCPRHWKCPQQGCKVKTAAVETINATGTTLDTWWWQINRLDGQISTKFATTATENTTKNVFLINSDFFVVVFLIMWLTATKCTMQGTCGHYNLLEKESSTFFRPRTPKLKERWSSVAAMRFITLCRDESWDFRVTALMLQSWFSVKKGNKWHVLGRKRASILPNNKLSHLFNHANDSKSV